jgi:hypothetical protein
MVATQRARTHHWLSIGVLAQHFGSRFGVDNVVSFQQLGGQVPVFGVLRPDAAMM